jgi:hypothetical protein
MEKAENPRNYLKMKILLSLLFLCYSGSSYSHTIIYEHLGKRWRFFEENNYVMITGERTGLLLQLPSEKTEDMPFEKSTVVMPDGKEKPLKFKIIDDLPGFWQCTFTEDHNLPPKGLYKYTIKLKNSKKDIVHLIRCSVTEGKPLQEVIIQKEAIPIDKKPRKNNTQPKAR